LQATFNELWFLPLGGTGEIGMNMNLYGHGGQWLMVDCGITFDSPLVEGGERHDVVCADPRFIVANKAALAGIIITHAHEDHIGALPLLWQRFKVPVYTTPYTAEILRRKLARTNSKELVPIIEVEANQRYDIGEFNVEWLAITHSLPEPCALVIRTAAGTVFHTADWKIDPRPVTGEAFEARLFKQLAKQNITAMVCDSTNALREGHSLSESDCHKGLLDLIKGTTGRVVVGCFSSNIARLITLARIAQQTGRYMALLGHSLQNTVSAARLTGHWPEDLLLQDPRYMGYLPKDEVLVVATGSQGEEGAALSRLAMGTYRDLELEEGDRVIFSSIIIPGNENKIEKLLNALKGRNITYSLSENSPLPIHASGHPHKTELQQMYQWVQPHIAVPVHGEEAHLKANAEIARTSHVPMQLLGKNGDLYILAPDPAIRPSAVSTGRIALAQ
jgi:ribonuclease J